MCGCLCVGGGNCRITKTIVAPSEIYTNREMLYVVGLGLGDAKDITVKGLEIVKRAKHVYLEAYTSILTVGEDVLVSLNVSDNSRFHIHLETHDY